MNWIPCSERLPRFPEPVEVTDGYLILESFIWDNEDEGCHFELNSMEDFIPIWWRPFEGSMIAENWEEHTIETKRPPDA